MTRIAPTEPGDQARLVLLQNWIGSIGSSRGGSVTTFTLPA